MIPQQQARTNEGKGSKCILIVEDDPAISEVLMLVLTYETAYQPVVVSSGQQALRAVQEVRPVLVLLNYKLPDMTGVQLYDQLHAQSQFATLPAIVVSANVPPYELKRRQLVGIKKPFDVDTLLQLIEQLVSSSPP